MSITALAIPADRAAPVATVEIGQSLAAIRAHVGGPYRGAYLEGLILGTDGTMYLDEDGKAKGLAVNPRATVLGWMHGLASDDRIVGDVLVTGPPDDDGDDTDVSVTFSEWVRRMAALIEAPA